MDEGAHPTTRVDVEDSPKPSEETLRRLFQFDLFIWGDLQETFSIWLFNLRRPLGHVLNLTFYLRRPTLGTMSPPSPFQGMESTRSEWIFKLIYFFLINPMLFSTKNMLEMLDSWYLLFRCAISSAQNFLQVQTYTLLDVLYAGDGSASMLPWALS